MIFIDNIEKLTLENNDYRRVLFTSDYSQIVLMSIPPKQDIEFEIHPYVDQFFRIEKGFGEIRIGKNQEKIYKFQDRTGILVPHNTYHRVVNTGKIPIKLYTIYSPPNHDKSKVEHFRPADENEKYKKIIKHLILQ